VRKEASEENEEGMLRRGAKNDHIKKDKENGMHAIKSINRACGII